MKLTKLYSMMFTVLLVIGLLAGCGSQENTNQEQDDSQKEEQQNQDKKVQDGDQQGSEEDKTSAFPVTITDANDYKVTIAEKPERIVTLIPSNTETAFALGLAEEIVGVTDNDNYPAEVNNKERVGGYQLNVEKIVSLQPDLVLASTYNQKKAIQQLRDNNVRVIVIQIPSSFDGLYKSINVMAKATGAQAKANTLITDMKAKVTSIAEKASQISEEERAKVFVETSPPPNMYSSGEGTFIDAMLDKINAINVAADVKGKVTEEQAVKYNPDAIILTYGGNVNKVFNREAWQSVNAIKNKRVYAVKPNLISRPGPRTVKGVEALAEAIYPDVFK